MMVGSLNILFPCPPSFVTETFAHAVAGSRLYATHSSTTALCAKDDPRSDNLIVSDAAGLQSICRNMR